MHCFTSLHPKDKSWVMELELKIHLVLWIAWHRLVLKKVKDTSSVMLWIASECFTPTCLMCGTGATIICNAHFWEQFVPCWKYHVSEHRYKLDLRETKQHDTHMFPCTSHAENYNALQCVHTNYIQMKIEYGHWTQIQIEYIDTIWTQILIEHRYKLNTDTNWMYTDTNWMYTDTNWTQIQSGALRLFPMFPC